MIIARRRDLNKFDIFLIFGSEVERHKKDIGDLFEMPILIPSV